MTLGYDAVQVVGQVGPEGTYPSVVASSRSREDAEFVVFISGARAMASGANKDWSGSLRQTGPANDGLLETFPTHRPIPTWLLTSRVDVVFLEFMHRRIFLELPFPIQSISSLPCGALSLAA